MGNDVLDWLSHTDQEHLASWLKPLQEIHGGSNQDEEDLLVEDDKTEVHEASPEPSFPSQRPPQEAQFRVSTDKQVPHGEPLFGGCRLEKPAVIDEDEEWLARQRITGCIGRLVNYAVGELPEDDVLGLRATPTGRITVTNLRMDGPAAEAGVAVGDELVSINGRKDFADIPASAILVGLQSPVALVFMGFIGKAHAEVRVKHVSETLCGMPSRAHISGASVRFCEVIVFQQPYASLLLETSNREKQGMYELQRDEAKDILQLALVDDGLMLV